MPGRWRVSIYPEEGLSIEEQITSEALNAALLGKSDYHLVGAAFGFVARKVSGSAELHACIASALADEGRSILNVLTDTDAGRIRRTDPRVQTVAFEDLASSLKTHATPDVA